MPELNHPAEVPPPLTALSLLTLGGLTLLIMLFLNLLLKAVNEFLIPKSSDSFQVLPKMAI